MLGSEIADALNIKISEVMEFKNKNKLRPKISFVGANIVYNFSEDDFLLMKKHFAKIASEKEKLALAEKQEKERKFQEYLKTATKEHPLVTDTRCFRLNWWPDSTPECFKDL